MCWVARVRSDGGGGEAVCVPTSTDVVVPVKSRLSLLRMCSTAVLDLRQCVDPLPKPILPQCLVRRQEWRDSYMRWLTYG